MLNKTITTLLLFVVTISLAGCSQTAQGSVTGTATYRQRIALPPDAVVTVRIEDVSKMDVAAEVIGEQVIVTNGAQVPISFTVKYDPEDILENHTYSLRVRIEDNSGKLLFINDTVVPVITGGNPTENVEVILVPVGS